MSEVSNPATQRVFASAARKGVALVFRHADAAAGADLGQIVNSLVFVAPRPGGRLVPIIGLLSARNQVDLHALAALTGEVAIRAASPEEARDLTGFAAGAMPPFGHGRDVRVLMDQDLCRYQLVWASAGAEEAVFCVPPRTLRALANAEVAPLARPGWASAVGQMTVRNDLPALGQQNA